MAGDITIELASSTSDRLLISNFWKSEVSSQLASSSLYLKYGSRASSSSAGSTGGNANTVWVVPI